MVRSETRFGAAHCSSRVSSIRTTRSFGLGDFGEQRVGERRLAGRRAAGDEDILALNDSGAEDRGLLLRHDAGGDIIVEREHGDSRLADGKGRRIDDRRQHALEALACFRQFRRDARRPGMNLGADMMRDESDDPLAILRRKSRARILKPARQAIEPEPSVGIEHDFDDASSSSHAAISAPSAVRSMRAPRESASALSE